MSPWAFYGLNKLFFSDYGIIDSPSPLMESYSINSILHVPSEEDI
jgi:hypothetical protein